VLVVLTYLMTLCSVAGWGKSGTWSGWMLQVCTGRDR